MDEKLRRRERRRWRLNWLAALFLCVLFASVFYNAEMYTLASIVGLVGIVAFLAGVVKVVTEG